MEKVVNGLHFQPFFVVPPKAIFIFYLDIVCVVFLTPVEYFGSFVFVTDKSIAIDDVTRSSLIYVVGFHMFCTDNVTNFEFHNFFLSKLKNKFKNWTYFCCKRSRIVASDSSTKSFPSRNTGCKAFQVEVEASSSFKPSFHKR